MKELGGPRSRFFLKHLNTFLQQQSQKNMATPIPLDHIVFTPRGDLLSSCHGKRMQRAVRFPKRVVNNFFGQLKRRSSHRSSHSGHLHWLEAPFPVCPDSRRSYFEVLDRKHFSDMYSTERLQDPQTCPKNQSTNPEFHRIIHLKIP